jgi:hypothetical protein
LRRGPSSGYGKIAGNNLEQTIGYGEDHHCMEAPVIRKKCGRDDLDVHFLVAAPRPILLL